jgi:phosphoribosylamine--glycine ligase
LNVLILGSGGREHALAWAIARSPACGHLLCAPGNPGTGRIAQNVAVDMLDAPAIATLCRSEAIDLVVVGPEAPLVAGVADRLRAEDIAVFGAGQAGAQLEGSKAFAKEAMFASGVPTAKSATVRSVAEAVKALEYVGTRVAVKADGLAAGKGVVMAESRDDALAAVRAAVEERVFGDAGRRVVIEEWLEGEEVSVIALTDGKDVRTLSPSQDHKRAYDGDRGPNTGGMGAYAPYSALTGAALDDAVARSVTPIVDKFAREGVDFRGVIYAGLMLTADGPKVLEYNVRFGDPETQVILPLVEGDFLDALLACARGELGNCPPLGLRAGVALTVVAAARGYPGRPETGIEIHGIDGPDDRGDALVFHAGTRDAGGGRIVTAGGRVLAVTGIGADIAAAKETAYDVLSTIRFEGMFHRSDIGVRAELASVPRKDGV